MCTATEKPLCGIAGPRCQGPVGGHGLCLFQAPKACNCRGSKMSSGPWASVALLVAFQGLAEGGQWCSAGWDCAKIACWG